MCSRQRVKTNHNYADVANRICPNEQIACFISVLTVSEHVDRNMVFCSRGATSHRSHAALLHCCGRWPAIAQRMKQERALVSRHDEDAAEPRSTMPVTTARHQCTPAAPGGPGGAIRANHQRCMWRDGHNGARVPRRGSPAASRSRRTETGSTGGRAREDSATSVLPTPSSSGRPRTGP